jgi:hypothetical protein
MSMDNGDLNEIFLRNVIPEIRFMFGAKGVNGAVARSMAYEDLVSNAVTMEQMDLPMLQSRSSSVRFTAPDKKEEYGERLPKGILKQIEKGAEKKATPSPPQQPDSTARPAKECFNCSEPNHHWMDCPKPIGETVRTKLKELVARRRSSDRKPDYRSRSRESSPSNRTDKYRSRRVSEVSVESEGADSLLDFM